MKGEDGREAEAGESLRRGAHHEQGVLEVSMEPLLCRRPLQSEEGKNLRAGDLGEVSALFDQQSTAQTVPRG